MLILADALTHAHAHAYDNAHTHVHTYLRRSTHAYPRPHSRSPCPTLCADAGGLQHQWMSVSCSRDGTQFAAVAHGGHIWIHRKQCKHCSPLYSIPTALHHNLYPLHRKLCPLHCKLCPLHRKLCPLHCKLCALGPPCVVSHPMHNCN